MTRELHCLQYGEQEIRYEIVRRPRKTLEIAVEPDASVVIAAPVGLAFDGTAMPVAAAAFVCSTLAWLLMGRMMH